MEVEDLQIIHFKPEDKNVPDEKFFVKIFQNGCINLDNLGLILDNNRKSFYERLCQIRYHVDEPSTGKVEKDKAYFLLGLENSICGANAEMKIDANDIFPLNKKGGYNILFRCDDPNCILKPLQVNISDKDTSSDRNDSPKAITGSAFGVFCKNMGSGVVAKLLGGPKVTVDVFPVVDNKGRCFIGMEEAKGKTLPSPKNSLPGEALSSVFQNAGPKVISTFIRETTWLQIQDVLSGQMDRNIDNILVDFNTGHVMGFDFDLSFPTSAARPGIACRCPIAIQKIAKGKFYAVDEIGGKGGRNFCLPPVIDAEMRRKILGIKSEDFGNELRSKWLTEPEIQAAIARLEDMKEQIEDSLVNIIEDSNEWESIEALKNYGCNSNNFYAFNFTSLLPY